MTVVWSADRAPGAVGAAAPDAAQRWPWYHGWSFQPAANSSPSRPVTLPHVWPRDHDYSTGTYRASFILPAHVPSLWLCFDAVAHVARVEVNGHEIGTHLGGFTPFAFDIASATVVGSNTVQVTVQDETAVTAEDSDVAYSQLGMERPGQGVSPAGIIGGVWLESRAEVHADRVEVKTSTRERTLAVHESIRNRSAAPAEATITQEVFAWPAASHPVLSIPARHVEIAASGETWVDTEASWADARWWSPEHPNLYVLRTTVTSGGHSDTKETRFGFREFWVDGRQFRLNGTPIRLMGSSASRDFRRDPATYREDGGRAFALETFRLLRHEFNFRAYRLHASIYPPGVIEAADEAGILLIEQSGIWSAMRDSYDRGGAKFLANTREQFAEWFWRDCDRPSVVIWDVENEMIRGERPPERLKWVLALDDFIHRWDPDRIVEHSGAGWYSPTQQTIHLHMQEQFATVLDAWEHQGQLPLICGEFWEGGRGEARLQDSFEPAGETSTLKDQAEQYRDKFLEMRYHGIAGVMPFRFGDDWLGAVRLDESGHAALDWVAPSVGRTGADALAPIAGFVWPRGRSASAGERVERTVVVCNDREETLGCRVACSWGGERHSWPLTLQPGEFRRLPVSFVAASDGAMEVSVEDATGHRLASDRLEMHVLPGGAASSDGASAARGAVAISLLPDSTDPRVPRTPDAAASLEGPPGARAGTNTVRGDSKDARVPQASGAALPAGAAERIHLARSVVVLPFDQASALAPLLTALGVVPTPPGTVAGRNAGAGAGATPDNPWPQPAKGTLVVVAPGTGANALGRDARAATRYLEAGGRILCLAQNARPSWMPVSLPFWSAVQSIPVEYRALGPATATKDLIYSRTLPLYAAAHPAFAGLGPDDFKEWSPGDGRVCDDLFDRPAMLGLRASGAWRALAGGTRRENISLAEFRAGRGTAIFCQLEVTAPRAPAAAHRLLANLLHYLDGPAWSAPESQIAMLGSLPPERLARLTNLPLDRVLSAENADPRQALATEVSREPADSSPNSEAQTARSAGDPPPGDSALPSAIDRRPLSATPRIVIATDGASPERIDALARAGKCVLVLSRTVVASLPGYSVEAHPGTVYAGTRSGSADSPLFWGFGTPSFMPLESSPARGAVIRWPKAARPVLAGLKGPRAEVTAKRGLNPSGVEIMAPVGAIATVEPRGSGFVVATTLEPWTAGSETGRTLLAQLLANAGVDLPADARGSGVIAIKRTPPLHLDGNLNDWTNDIEDRNVSPYRHADPLVLSAGDDLEASGICYLLGDETNLYLAGWLVSRAAPTVEFSVAGHSIVYAAGGGTLLVDGAAVAASRVVSARARAADVIDSRRLELVRKDRRLGDLEAADDVTGRTFEASIPWSAMGGRPEKLTVPLRIKLQIGSKTISLPDSQAKLEP